MNEKIVRILLRMKRNVKEETFCKGYVGTKTTRRDRDEGIRRVGVYCANVTAEMYNLMSVQGLVGIRVEDNDVGFDYVVDMGYETYRLAFVFNETITKRGAIYDYLEGTLSRESLTSSRVTIVTARGKKLFERVVFE